MLVTIGDLVEDVAVHHDGSIRVGSDTEARIERRRGGSAANTAATAGRIGHRARFVGRVGADPIGGALVDDLAADGVDVSFVQRAGRTGTIVVLIDNSGERTMFPDRGACLDLADPAPSWLGGASALHVPLYSFTEEPLRSTTLQVVEWAHERSVLVSVDVSSTAIIDDWSPDTAREFLHSIRPDVVFANEDEAAMLGIDGRLAGAITVVKRGPDPLTIYSAAGEHAVTVPPVDDVTDTTGAGDAFAAGYLCSPARDIDPRAAALHGCRAAAALFASR